MDPASAISNAQEVVAQANLPADLQQAAFAEVLGYFLAGGSVGSGQAASPGAAGWSQVTNTTSPEGAPPAGTAPAGPEVGIGSITPVVQGVSVDPAGVQPAGWSRVENTLDE